MSAGPESTADLVAVACVVESSLLLASEWSRILIEYVYPLLKRLDELHPSHQFRLAFVTYGAADTRPLPLLTKRFFAPLSQVTKELREEPSKLGIGQTNSGSGRGLSALEGLVAAIELFDILMASANFTVNHAQTQSPQKESRSLISHLLHIAASPPDNAQRPHYNTLQHLDVVTWDSIPAELRRRKINMSLISLRMIPQFQELQSSVAGSGAQSPWFNVRTPHVLLLAGFPIPQKTSIKRQTDALPSDQSPDTKRQKVVADPISKTSSASPALASARTPQTQRSQQPASSQVSQPPPTTVPGQNPSPTQHLQPTLSVPTSTSATSTPAPLPPSGSSLPGINSEILEQVVAPRGIKIGQMMERLKALEREIAAINSQISNAQNTGQTAILAGLQKDLAAKSHIKEQIKMLLKQHYQKMLLAKEALNAQAGAAGSAEAGPSTQSHPPNAPGASGERPIGPAMEEHKPVVSDSQIFAQFWQSRGGTISAANGGSSQAGPSQTQSLPTTMTPEIAAQMQKLSEKKGIRPQSFGSSSQISGITSHEAGVHPNATNNQAVATSTWQGTFSWTFPKSNGQVANEVQVHVAGIVTPPAPNDVRTDIWPKNLTLNPCKEPLKESAELSVWLRRHKARSHIIRFIPIPRTPDGSLNEQKFHTLSKFMADHRVYAYAGWQLPSGKFSHNLIIFPIGSNFGGAVFPEGLPDLPGNGNTLDVQPNVEETKHQPLSGINLPPALVARLQGLEPAKQKQLLAHFIREQLRRQQLQQTQQTHIASSQALNSLGKPTPSNPYGAIANIPAGLHANVENSAAPSTGGGTVNYEMLQSFMQRSAEGASSQGMSSS